MNRSFNSLHVHNHMDRPNLIGRPKGAMALLLLLCPQCLMYLALKYKNIIYILISIYEPPTRQIGSVYRNLIGHCGHSDIVPVPEFLDPKHSLTLPACASDRCSQNPRPSVLQSVQEEHTRQLLNGCFHSKFDGSDGLSSVHSKVIRQQLGTNSFKGASW